MTNLAIMGLGRWGGQLIEAVQSESDTVRFHKVISRNASRVQSQAERFNLEICNDLHEVLDDPDTHGVVLATPHSTHEEQIISCVNAGRAVFVEKPFTLSLSSAKRALVNAGSDLVVAAGHNRRFLPSVIELKQVLDEGRLGKILFIESNFSGNVASTYEEGQWRVNGDESPAGGMAGAGIHMIDLIIHLCAPIRSVYAESTRQVLSVEMDDTTCAVFQLQTGAGALLTTIMATAPTFRLQVFGSDGTAELRNEDHLELTDLSGNCERRTFERVDTKRAELEAFASAIRGEAPYPISREDVLNGVAAFEAVGLSSQRNEQIVIQ